MILRPWHLLLVFAALIVPLQAGALSGSGSSSLQVSATLDYCGVGSSGISCKIDASWSGVEGAESYTATATLADGSVVDMGTVGAGAGGGATSIWVPYTGSGVYTVTVSAWGSDSDGKREKIDDAKAKIDGPAKAEQQEDTGNATNGDEDKEPAAPAEEDGTEPPAADGDLPPAEPAPPVVAPTPDPAPVPDPETDPAEPSQDPPVGTGAEGGPTTPSPSAQSDPAPGATEAG